MVQHQPGSAATAEREGKTAAFINGLHGAAGNVSGGCAGDYLR
jgi:hypothetical protein